MQKNREEFGINLGINFGINETQQRIVALMTTNTEITAGQIAESINMTKRHVESNIRKLKSLGIVEREGAKKNGRWIVKTALTSEETQ